MNVPLSAPNLTDDEIRAVCAILRTPTLSLGSGLEEFERAFASDLGVPHAVGVSSGTAALHLAMIAAGVGDGDLVITSPFSFIASSNAVLYERGVPLFVDVDPATGNIDPALACEAVHDLASGSSRSRRWLPPSMRAGLAPSPDRLKALLPVHCFGQPASMMPLIELGRQHALSLIEDSCEALGAMHRGRLAGTFGHAAAFGFFPNKQITTGEGGMLVTRSDEWARLFRSLRNQGRDVSDREPTYARLGYNYRLDEMSAALGLAQLRRMQELLTGRAQVAAWYQQRLRAWYPLIETPTVAPSTTRMSWFVFVVRLHPGMDRAAIMRDLAACHVPSRPYFPPIHLLPFYRERLGYGPGAFPVAEDLGRRSLALPFSGVMTEEQVDYVVSTLLRVTQGYASATVA